ncbi:MAG: BrnT family toxin [Terriglobia bacterium]
MTCQWDQAKNRANLAKHGVDFSDAVAVFEDDLALTRPDLDSRSEIRSVILGMDGFGRHLVVVFTDRGTSIRIISARLATKQERKSYES